MGLFYFLKKDSKKLIEPTNKSSEQGEEAPYY